MSHLVTGMQTGHISIWEYAPDPPAPTPPDVPISAADQKLGLIVGLAVGVPVFVIGMAILLYCCLCGRCVRLKGWRVNI